MRYMLDTNIVSDIIRNPGGAAANRVRDVAIDICVSVVVAAELQFGCVKRGSVELTRRVAAFLTAVPIMPLQPPVDRLYGSIRASLEKAGQPIGSNDLFIAAHACALGATLVTANLAEFRRVPGLTVENWLA